MYNKYLYLTNNTRVPRLSESVYSPNLEKRQLQERQTRNKAQQLNASHKAANQNITRLDCRGQQSRDNNTQRIP